MQGKPGKIITLQMLEYEFRNVVGNPYVHIFGVGMPVLLAALITKAVSSEITDDAVMKMTSTTIYLGMGVLIPMAILLMGYAISYAGELEKGIPERMRLFGIRNSVSLCNRAIAEMIFIMLSFVVFFGTAQFLSEIEKPVFSGLVCYSVSIFAFCIICFMLGHGIACVCHSFGKTYCVSMILYFGFMISAGMMGIRYENMPKWAQAIAKLLPATYINRDIYQIWRGESYNYMPMIQSYLFLGAVSGIVLFLGLRKKAV